MAEPRVSIAMVVGKRRARAARALRSVLRQPGIDQTEIIVLDAGGVGVEPLPGSDHPAVRTLQADDANTFGTLRARAVRQARSPIVAFLEDHIEVGPDWLSGLLQAFEGRWAAVGAEVHNLNAQVGISPLIALINYGLWTPPMQKGEASMLAGNNTAYRRQVLMAYESELDDLMLSDTVLQWRLTGDGHRMQADPSVVIRHLNPTTSWDAVQAEYLYHWAFAALRSSTFGWSILKRMGYVLLSPAVPWLRFARLLRLVRKKWPDRFAFYLAHAPRLLLYLHAAAAGQDVGLLAGMRHADAKFTNFELNTPRPGPSAEG